MVYDSIGAASFDASIKSLATYGLFASFGATTGEAPAVPPSLLQHSGSLYFTRPTLADYINQRFPLSEVVRAHEALASGNTTGSTLLLP